jgi:hypothetical protein
MSLRGEITVLRAIVFRRFRLFVRRGLPHARRACRPPRVDVPRWGLVLMCGAYAPSAPAAAAVQAAAAPEAQGSPDTTLAEACRDFYSFAEKRRISAAPFTTITQSPLRAGATHATLLHLLEQVRVGASATTDPAMRALGYFYGSCLADTTGTADQGLPGDTVRAGYCLTKVDQSVLLQKALSKVYANHVLPPAAAAQVREMVAQITATVRGRLQALPWVSDRTKQQALAVLAAKESSNRGAGDVGRVPGRLLCSTRAVAYGLPRKSHGGLEYARAGG